MRLNVSHTFWRNSCSHLLFGFVDSHVGKLHYHLPKQLKADRFFVLLNKPSKHKRTSAVPAGILGHDAESPVTVVIAPAWKIPLLLRGYTDTERKSSNHQAFIWIVGLAVSLVSLGALRVFELCEWFSKVTVGEDSKILDFEYDNNRPGISLIPWPLECDPPFGSSRIHSRRISVPSPGGRMSTDGWSNYTASTACSHKNPFSTNLLTAFNEPLIGSERPFISQIDPLASLFDVSPLQSLNASLNCPHFTHGFNQMCLICWLNNPDQWVFGPVLNSLDRSLLNYLDTLANLDGTTQSHKITGLQIASSILSHLRDSRTHKHSSLSSPSDTTWRNVLLRTEHPSNNSSLGVQSESHAARKRLLSCDQLDSLACSHSIPKVARSSGDGAPSTSSADVYLPSESKPYTKGFPTSRRWVDNSVKRPMFYTHDDPDVDLSSRTSVSDRNPAFTSLEQMRLSASRVLSKALELMGSKLSNSERNQIESMASMIASPTTCRTDSRGCANRTGSADSRRSGSQFLLHGCDSDGFEYDEVYCSNSKLLGYSSPMALDPEEEERIQEEEEAQLMHLISTLTSLLDRKGENMECSSSGSSNCAPETVTTVKKPNSGPVALKVPYTDLFQSASDITEDLHCLEEVLDSLRYKLQANQIELEQAEDNLDYAWHLHDNLDGSASVSLSYGPSSSGSLASLASDVVSHDPCAVTPSIVVPSTVIPNSLEGPQNCTQKNTDPHLLCPRDSLLTSFTSSYTSVEHSPMGQSMTDSACEPSICTYSSTMIASVSDAQSAEFRINQSRLINESVTLDRPRPRKRSNSKRSATLRKRATFHVRRSYNVPDSDPSSDWEEPVDPDGFLHPEMTFDKDGTIDWSVTNEASVQ